MQNRFAPFPFYPFLFGSGEFAGVEGGEEGKVEVGRIRTYAGEIESPFRAVSRRLFRTILAGASSRRKKRGGHNEEMEEASRRGDEKRRRRTCSSRAYVSWRCLPATSRSLRRHVLDFFARNSNRVLMQRRGNKNGIFLRVKNFSTHYYPIILLLFLYEAGFFPKWKEKVRAISGDK